MKGKKKRRFSAEFKAEAVQLVQESGKSVAEAARDLGLSASALGSWVRQAEIDAGRGLPSALTTAEKQELSQLRKECRELRKERDFLKKAAAFFANHKR